MTFWDHLDELRGSLLRMLAAVAVMAVICFSLKDLLFDVILAPTKSDFITYRLLGAEPFTMRLINTQLTEQLMVHLRMAAYMGFLLASPLILYELFRFVSPALYRNERRYASVVVMAAYVMFIVGTLLNYFLIFPLIARFLGTYQVSPDVENMLTLNSYVDTLMMMSLVIGIVFEMPVVAALMGKLNIISAKMMKRYRKHALVVILIVAAIITPTADIFTLLIVSLPIWALYETSILIVKKLQKEK
ncbi:MAG: twin-arginine translocase subunit TatC [Prevotella sp.]|nr:twin-arginine translocase subunit TatC [Prevotella sp.]